jgi:hypothetical protein
MLEGEEAEGADVRERQLAYLRDSAEPGMEREAQDLERAAQDLPLPSRLPLVEIAVGTLRGLTTRQASKFAHHLRELEGMDGRTSLFEWLVRRLLERHLGGAKERAQQAKRGRRRIKGLGGAVSKVLSAQAYASHDDREQVKLAFAAGQEVLASQVQVRLVHQEACTPLLLDQALLALDRCRPKSKQALLTACARVAAADDVVGPAEMELVRALAAALSCPMPPLVAHLPQDEP